MSPLFPNIQSTLDLNGPELSILKATTLESGESSFSITPSLPDGSTKIDLVSLDNFSAFDSSKIYTLTANGTFDLTLDLEGAGGGNGGTTNFGTGGKGGKVTGTVSFILGEEYKLVIGSAGEFNAGAGAVGGGGASSGIGDASQPATYKWSDGVEASSWFSSDLSENMFDGSTTNFSKAETKFGTTSTINTYLGWDKDGNNLAFDLNLPEFEAPLEIFIKSAEIYTYTVNGVDVTSGVDVSGAMQSGSWITLTSDTTVGINSFRVTAPNPNTNVQISAVRSNGILMTTTLTYSAGGSGGGYTGIFKTSISQENALLIAGGGGGASAQDDPNRGANPARKANGGDGGGLTGGYIKPNGNAKIYNWVSGVEASGWSASDLSSFMFDGNLRRFSKAQTNGRKIDFLGWSKSGGLPTIGGPVEIWIRYAEWGAYTFIVNGVSVTPDTTGSQGQGAWVKISDGPVSSFRATAIRSGFNVQIAGVKSNGVLLSSGVPYVDSDSSTQDIIENFLVSGEGGTQTFAGDGGTTNLTENNGSSGAALLGGAGNIFNSTGGGGGGYFGGGGGGYFAATINGSGGGGSGFIATTNIINGYFSNASNTGAGKVNFVRSTFTDKGLILSGIATAKFPDSQTGRNTNTGDIAYRWYEVGIGSLSDSTNIVGSATTTLSISDISFVDDGREFFLRADYIPSAYGSKSTPNALNDPLDFSTYKLGVPPSIIIVTQPEDSTVVQNLDTTFSVTASIQDGTNDSLSFDWQYNGQSLSGNFFNLIRSQAETTTISGRQSTLTIQNSSVELAKISCIISSEKADSPISSDTANLDVSEERTFIKWEKFGNAIRTEQGNRDLATSGPFTARALADNLHRTIQMWSPERDIEVKITMGGAAGRTVGGGGRGGEGGISVFKMTMKQNTEYTIKLGVNSFQGGGPRGGNNGGGGLAVIYEMAKVLAVCGGGGGGGKNGRGGNGGGLGIPGETVYFNGSGNGGVLIDVDALPNTGASQAGRTGYNEYNNEDRGSGRLSGCTIGNYWSQQGKLPCQPLGNNVEFLTSQGATYSPTTGIERGYKVGQGHRNNGGAGSGNQGGGGAGARGGEGASGNGAGGGGASGYYASQVTLLSSPTLKDGTQDGGNNDVSFISVEAYNPNLDDNQEPLYPPSTTLYQTERTVTWKVVRSAAFRSQVTFIRQSGVGPDSITWGPNGGDVTSQISAGAVYVKEDTKIEGKSGGHLKVNSDGSLGFDDYSGRDRPDHGYEDLTIYPSIGTFSSSSSRPEHQGDTWKADWT